MKFIIIIVIAISLAASLKIIGLVSKRFSQNSNLGKTVYSIQPLFILVIWTVFLFWCMYFLFYNKPYYNFIVFSMIIVTFLATGWFFVKDFVAGVAFKMQNRYLPGDLVQFGEIEGKLNTLLLTHVSIYTKDGKLVKIPYSNLSNKIVSQKSEIGNLGKNKFTLTIKKSKQKNIESEIFSILMNSPWRVKGQNPMVNLLKENDDTLEFEIQFEARNEKHLGYLIEYLNNSF